ncbi:hypothetical protein H5410_015803 [Solanum commersonii]|uniref:N-acetyltransferase domain-containing protein n=1 Tax=Solanum commersonii TaxID=4109 RepID=A0A9J5ZV51_SOLCO|nr:hypothetical protein H5410_015803 [Solanum commersonii]
MSSACRKQLVSEGFAPISEDVPMSGSVMFNSVLPSQEQQPAISPNALSVLHPPKNEISGTLSITKSERLNFQSSNKKHSRKRKRLEWKTISHETELCPDAVSECNDNYMSNHRSLESLQELKEHLSYLGWKIEQAKDYNIIRTRYVAPDGKIFQSLRKVCKMLEKSETWVEGQKTSYDGSSDDLNLSTCLAKAQTCSEVSELQYTSQEPIVPPEICPEAKGDRRELRYCPPHGSKKFISLRTACIWCMQQWKAEGQMPELFSRSNVLEFQGNLVPQRTSCKKLSMATFSVLPLPKEHAQLNKVTVCEISKTRKKSNHAGGWNMLKEGKSRSSRTVVDGTESQSSARQLRSSKRARQATVSSSLHHTPRTVLSWLIDNSVVLPRAKVQYCVKKDGRLMAEGWITCAGIKCKCCQKVYGISNFEVHAGSNYHRPSANIFLEDGRSLLDCQLQMKEKSIVRNMRKRSPLLKKCSHLGTNDNVCSVCHYGGELLLCDECPSSFHTGCLGMKVSFSLSLRFPMANGFAHHAVVKCVARADLIKTKTTLQTSVYLSVVSVSTSVRSSFDHFLCPYSSLYRIMWMFGIIDVDQLCTDHARCVRDKGLQKLDCYPVGKWFCNKRCEQCRMQLTGRILKEFLIDCSHVINPRAMLNESPLLSIEICLGIHQLLAKPVMVGIDILTWTLLKYVKPDDFDSDAAKDEFVLETYSKLGVALDVMHECFEPVEEPYTRRDLMEYVIFNRWSELNRLNFQGFYTVLLERNDEVITVATVRIYGEKVAEVPLVATRFQYRRLGMCRILMNELEKGAEGRVVAKDVSNKLMELGVERLVLPAAPTVLNTWTISFGFTMGTVMCQKLLQNIPPEVSSESTGRWRFDMDGLKLHFYPEAYQTQLDHIKSKETVELDGNSALSEVFQAEQIEGSEIVDQGYADAPGGCESNDTDAPTPLITMANQQAPLGCQDETSLQYQDEVTDSKVLEKTGVVQYKCYKRRKKISAVDNKLILEGVSSKLTHSQIVKGTMSHEGPVDLNLEIGAFGGKFHRWIHGLALGGCENSDTDAPTPLITMVNQQAPLGCQDETSLLYQAEVTDSKVLEKSGVV